VDRITDILVIVDPLHRDQPAIAKAANLARSFGAAIEMLICDTRATREGHLEGDLPALSNALLTDNLEALLEELAEPLRDDGLDVTTHLISGDPLHESVFSWMRNSPADLVVKDTHHHSFARRTLAIDTDRHFIRGCPVPLLLTKPKVWGTPPVLMAAVDPGHVSDPSAELDHRIMDVTVSMAGQIGALALAVHAYFPSTIVAGVSGGMFAAVGVSAEALESERLLRRSRIKQITDAYQIDDAYVHVDAAMPTEYLPRMATERRADIVVMGGIARSALKRAVIGSTAERVLEVLPCDMLVVKPAIFARHLPF
jgi:universal stress protein E